MRTVAHFFKHFRAWLQIVVEQLLDTGKHIRYAIGVRRAPQYKQAFVVIRSRKHYMWGARLRSTINRLAPRCERAIRSPSTRRGAGA